MRRAKEIISLEECSRDLLQSTEAVMTDTLMEADGPTPDSRLIGLWERQETLQAEWLKRKHDRQLRIDLAQADIALLDYSRQLRTEQWTQLCNHLNGQLGSKNPSTRTIPKEEPRRDLPSSSETTLAPLGK